MDLDLPWNDWYALAQNNSNFGTWDKSLWETWLNNYGQYKQAYDNYVLNLTGSSSTEQSVVGASTGGENSTGGANSTENVTISSEGSNTVQQSYVYWKPEYNNDNYTLDMILTDLQGSGVLDEFENWFNLMFLPDGVIATSMSAPAASGSTSANTTGGIPAGLEKIVAWISENVDKEVQNRCTACQLSSYTGVSENQEGGVGGTEGSSGNETLPPTNVTTNEIPPLMIDFNTYVMPQACQYANQDTTTVGGSVSAADLICCQNTTLNISDCYTLDKVNDFLELDIPAFCFDMENVANNCAGVDEE